MAPMIGTLRHDADRRTSGSRSSRPPRSRCTCGCCRVATRTTSSRRSSRRWPGRCVTRSRSTRAAAGSPAPKACCERVPKVVVLDYGSRQPALRRAGAGPGRRRRHRDRRSRPRRCSRRSGGARRRCLRRLRRGIRAVGGDAVIARAGGGRAAGARHLRRHAGAVRGGRGARRAHRGLGLLPGEVLRIQGAGDRCRTWAGTRRRPPPESALFAGVESERFYFVHSYAAARAAR